MPLYEYECESCGQRFERIQKFSDPPVETCPVCGGPVKKLLSSPAIQFKGSGWYITDYAKKAGGDSTSPGSPKSDKSESKSETSSSAGDSSSSSSSSPSSANPTKKD